MVSAGLIKSVSVPWSDAMPGVNTMDQSRVFIGSNQPRPHRNNQEERLKLLTYTNILEPLSQ